MREIIGNIQEVFIISLNTTSVMDEITKSRAISKIKSMILVFDFVEPEPNELINTKLTQVSVDHLKIFNSISHRSRTPIITIQQPKIIKYGSVKF